MSSSPSSSSLPLSTDDHRGDLDSREVSMLLLESHRCRTLRYLKSADLFAWSHEKGPRIVEAITVPFGGSTDDVSERHDGANCSKREADKDVDLAASAPFTDEFCAQFGRS